MLLTSLPFDYATLVDTDRVRSTKRRPFGTRVRRAENRDKA